MKTLIAACDFSSTARNAINYAAEMAVTLKTKLVLFHVYSIPLMAEGAMPAFTLDDLEKDCHKKLKRIALALHKKYGKKLVLETVCRCGFAVDEIKSYAHDIKADMIVMGMQGAGFIAEKINGSVTTAIMSDAGCPVLSVDRKVKFVKPKKIVLATDLKEIKHNDFARILSTMAGVYKSKLMILNVFKPSQPMPTYNEANENLKLDRLMKGLKHKFYYQANNDVVAGINDFIKKEEAHMVVMIARKHSLFQKLFSEPQTKRMAFHTQTPLLTFQE